MTVGELIETLKGFPQDHFVIVYTESEFDAASDLAEVVEIERKEHWTGKSLRSVRNKREINCVVIKPKYPAP